MVFYILPNISINLAITWALQVDIELYKLSFIELESEFVSNVFRSTLTLISTQQHITYSLVFTSVHVFVVDDHLKITPSSPNHGLHCGQEDSSPGRGGSAGVDTGVVM